MKKPTRKKALWTQLVKPKPDAKAARQRAYRKRVKEYLGQNWLCRGFCYHRGRTARATDVHHKHGRLGDLLMDESLWIPVCRKCHNWIHNYPESARMFGLLALKGMWNRKP